MFLFHKHIGLRRNHYSLHFLQVDVKVQCMYIDSYTLYMYTVEVYIYNYTEILFHETNQLSSKKRDSIYETPFTWVV